MSTKLMPRIFKLGLRLGVPILLAGALATACLDAEVAYETLSPYHRIRVVDQEDIRILSFDGSMETRMSLSNPLKGHFEYTEFFHMPWLWQDRVEKVLMIGLGGGSAQRAFAHFHPDTRVETVELDPKVKDVAEQFFHVQESQTLQIHIGDGRVFLRRSAGDYNAIILDAYTSNRYGTFVPHHLATREFFQLASDKLSPNGVLLYNVIGATNEPNTNALGSIYNSMATVFPQIYLFPAQTSRNVVLMGLKEPNNKQTSELQTRATQMIQNKKLPDSFPQRLNALRSQPPASANRSPILTDNYTPPRGLMVERR